MPTANPDAIAAFKKLYNGYVIDQPASREYARERDMFIKLKPGVGSTPAQLGQVLDVVKDTLAERGVVLEKSPQGNDGEVGRQGNDVGLKLHARFANNAKSEFPDVRYAIDDAMKELERAYIKSPRASLAPKSKTTFSA
jgi:hypothetical protein